jgi:hypothetical protein
MVRLSWKNTILIGKEVNVMSAARLNTFRSLSALDVAGTSYDIHRLDALAKRSIGHVDELPFSLKVLLENLLRCEDGRFVHPEDIEALAEWKPIDAARKSAKCGEVCVFALGANVIQKFCGGAAGYGNLPSSEFGISGASRLRRRRRREENCVSGFAGGHGFAYHDGEFAGSFWMGRRRN